MKKSVLILAGDTDGNLGDRAIVLSMCDEFRRLLPDIDITLLSGDPARDRDFFGANTIRRGVLGLPALIRAAIKSDLVLCGGGGLFQDDTSLIKMPYWALRTLFIRLFAGRVVGYSLGVGPLTWASSRAFARLAFACMDEISVRDPEAMSTSIELTSKPVRIVPVPALLLAAAPREEAASLLQQAGVPLDGRPIVGVAIRKSFHQQATLIPHKYAVKYRLRKIPGARESARMITLLAKVLDKIIETQSAWVVFVPTYNVAHEGDNIISEEVINKMESDRASILKITDPGMYKAVAGHFSVMLGGRMHPTIFSADQGVPVVGLAYNQKFHGFFDLLGQKDMVIDIEDFVRDDRVDDLVALLTCSILEGSGSVARVAELKKQTQAFNERILC